MTFKRIYRGAPVPMPLGACPHCGKVVTITATGKRRAHKADGMACSGSRVQVSVVAAHLDGPVEINIPPGRVSDTVHEWVYCPDCGRHTRVKLDGTLRAHRPVPDTFAGPYCPGSNT